MEPSLYLNRVKSKARQMKIKFDAIDVSDKPNKKFMLSYNNKTIHFGNRGSNDYIILQLTNNPDADKIRNAYRARHGKIRTKNGLLAYQIEYSPAYLSYHLLW